MYNLILLHMPVIRVHILYLLGCLGLLVKQNLDSMTLKQLTEYVFIT